MSIIFFEGFDHYSNSKTDPETSIFMNKSMWSHYGGPEPWWDIAVEPRNNGQCMNIRSADIYSNELHSATFGSFTHVIGGFAFRVDSAWEGNPFFCLNSGLAGPLDFRISLASFPSDFNFQIYSDGNQIVEIPALAITKWHYVEYEVNTGGSPNQLKIWLNGQQMLDSTTTSSDEITKFSIPTHSGNIVFFDDMYLLDPGDSSGGSTFQDRLGPISIEPSTLSGDGTNNDMVALSGGDKYVEVDETPGESDLDASYVYGTQAGDAQSFTVTGVDTVLPILAVSPSVVVKKPTQDATTVGMDFLHSKGGSDMREDTGLVLQDEYRMVVQNLTTLPDASPLTAANVEATEWGIEIT